MGLYNIAVLDRIATKDHKEIFAGNFNLLGIGRGTMKAKKETIDHVIVDDVYSTFNEVLCLREVIKSDVNLVEPKRNKLLSLIESLAEEIELVMGKIYQFKNKSSEYCEKELNELKRNIQKNILPFKGNAYSKFMLNFESTNISESFNVFQTDMECTNIGLTLDSPTPSLTIQVPPFKITPVHHGMHNLRLSNPRTKEKRKCSDFRIEDMLCESAPSTNMSSFYSEIECKKSKSGLDSLDMMMGQRECFPVKVVEKRKRNKSEKKKATSEKLVLKDERDALGKGKKKDHLDSLTIFEDNVLCKEKFSPKPTESLEAALQIKTDNSEKFEAAMALASLSSIPSKNKDNDKNVKSNENRLAVTNEVLGNSTLSGDVRSVVYNCEKCNFQYMDTTRANPWWELVRNLCPICKCMQVPRVDVTHPVNVIDESQDNLVLSAFLDDDNESCFSKNTGDSSDDLEDEHPHRSPGLLELKNLQLSGRTDFGLSNEASAKLLILMEHARFCKAKHNKYETDQICNSVKFIMLHLRDCPGTTSDGKLCPHSWCNRVKSLVLHLLDCPKADECEICNPKNLTASFLELRRKNRHMKCSNGLDLRIL